ncbi:hypothetical protein ACFQ0M_02830 [Kitasatospora aburaviensis]
MAATRSAPPPRTARSASRRPGGTADHQLRPDPHPHRGDRVLVDAIEKGNGIVHANLKTGTLRKNAALVKLLSDLGQSDPLPKSTLLSHVEDYVLIKEGSGWPPGPPRTRAAPPSSSPPTPAPAPPSPPPASAWPAPTRACARTLPAPSSLAAAWEDQGLERRRRRPGHPPGRRLPVTRADSRPRAAPGRCVTA